LDERLVVLVEMLETLMEMEIEWLADLQIVGRVLV